MSAWADPLNLISGQCSECGAYLADDCTCWAQPAPVTIHRTWPTWQVTDPTTGRAANVYRKATAEAIAHTWTEEHR